MTERGLPIADGAPACPFVAFDDQRDDRADRPDPRHRCYAESPPTPRARAHQEAYCLSANFPVCPTFQDWARREAARVLPMPPGGIPAERPRDVPVQREAGERPPAFGAAAGGTDWPGSRSPSPPPGSADPGRGAAGQEHDEQLHMPPVAEERDSGAMLDRLLSRPRDEEADTADRGDARAGNPWDLPTRRPAKPEWSAPPPWASRSQGSASDTHAPDFLRTGPTGAGDAGIWSRPGADESDEAAGDGDGAVGDPAADREATMARLRALGMGGDASADEPEDEDDDHIGIGQRPASSLGRAPDEIPDRRPSYAPYARPGAAPDFDAPQAGLAGGVPGAGRGFSAGAAGPAVGDGAAAQEPSGRSAGGLAGILGWDRRPKAGRAPKPSERNPAWERPRRYEAYPTLKTRVGLPVPSRLWLAFGAVLVAAAILFFVPPLFLKQGGGGPGASGASHVPGASGSGAVGASPSRSAGPTAKPAPTPLTYTIKQGDTLSSIAKKFHVTVDEILAANKNIKNPNKIAVGDMIVIPTPAPSEIVDGVAPSST